MRNLHLLLSILSFIFFACNSQPVRHEEIDDPAYTNLESTSIKQTKMKGFAINIEKGALANGNYREVVYTGHYMQLVLMSIKPGEEIGEEIHLKSDQFFRFESGTGKCIVNGINYDVKAGDVVIAPSGSKHNVINTDSNLDLKLYTIYAMPNHKDGIVRTTKDEATKHEAKFDGLTTE